MVPTARDISAVPGRAQIRARALAALALLLPVPLFAATGLTLPLPHIVKRLATSLASGHWAGEDEPIALQDSSLAAWRSRLARAPRERTLPLNPRAARSASTGPSGKAEVRSVKPRGATPALASGPGSEGRRGPEEEPLRPPRGSGDAPGSPSPTPPIAPAPAADRGGDPDEPLDAEKGSEKDEEETEDGSTLLPPLPLPPPPEPPPDPLDPLPLDPLPVDPLPVDPLPVDPSLPPADDLPDLP